MDAARPQEAETAVATPYAAPSQVLTVAAVQAALAAAVETAQASDIAVSVAVVDASGVLLGALRMPGAFLHSLDIAIDKAYTAASFGLSTGDWPQAFRSHSPAVQAGLSSRPRFVGFGGGFPIQLGGVRAGAIGVSGGSEAEDEHCARAALRQLGLL